MSPRHAAGHGSLVRVEMARLAARRLVQLLVAAGVLGFIVFAVVSFSQYSRPTAASLAVAEQQRDADLVASAEYYQSCVSDPDIPEDSLEFQCGSPPSEDDFLIEYYVDTPPFVLATDLPAIAAGVAAGTAMLAFLVGATYVGAEWSSRSMVALLFWEPRRLTVVGVKTVVAGLAGAVLALVGQAAWLGQAWLLAAWRGNSDGLPPDFWGEVAAQVGRAGLLGLLAALLGFALANLIRNTGAALGVGFAYFALAESALRGIFPRFSPYLVTDSALALVLPGGFSSFVPGDTMDEFGNVEYIERVVSNLRGGVTLVTYTAVLLLIGTWLFRRRDLH